MAINISEADTDDLLKEDSILLSSPDRQGGGASTQILTLTGGNSATNLATGIRPPKLATRGGVADGAILAPKMVGDGTPADPKRLRITDRELPGIVINAPRLETHGWTGLPKGWGLLCTVGVRAAQADSFDNLSFFGLWGLSQPDGRATDRRASYLGWSIGQGFAEGLFRFFWRQDDLNINPVGNTPIEDDNGAIGIQTADIAAAARQINMSLYRTDDNKLRGKIYSPAQHPANPVRDGEVQRVSPAPLEADAVPPLIDDEWWDRAVMTFGGFAFSAADINLKSLPGDLSDLRVDLVEGEPTDEQVRDFSADQPAAYEVPALVRFGTNREEFDDGYRMVNQITATIPARAVEGLDSGKAVYRGVEYNWDSNSVEIGKSGMAKLYLRRVPAGGAG